MSGFVQISSDGESPSCVRRYSVIWLALMVLFFVSTIGLSVGLAINKGKTKIEYRSEVEHIPPPESMMNTTNPIDGKFEGASKYIVNGRVFDIDPSPYHRHIDFYDEKPTKTLKILPKFKTYQQTHGWSCGPSSAFMAMNYMGDKEVDEAHIATITGLEPGANVAGMINAFKDRQFKTFSSNDKLEGKDITYDTPTAFITDLKKYLNQGIPFLIKLGGHWSTIIGYDDMGVVNPTDEYYQNFVLILADSWDTHDQLQDGYIIYEFDYFWNLWTNSAMKSDPTLYQQFVVGFR